MLHSACPEKTCQVRLQLCVFALLPNAFMMLGLGGLQTQRSIPGEEFAVHGTQWHVGQRMRIYCALLA